MLLLLLIIIIITDYAPRSEVYYSFLKYKKHNTWT